MVYSEILFSLKKYGNSNNVATWVNMKTLY